MTRHRGATPEIRAIPWPCPGARLHCGDRSVPPLANHRPAGRFVLALPLTPGSRRAAATAHRAFRQAGVRSMPVTRHKAKPHREQLVSS